MSKQIEWKVGCEVELLAPEKSNRGDLAKKIVSKLNGEIHTEFFCSSDSLEPKCNFSLTKAFKVNYKDQSNICSLVDDITIQQQLLQLSNVDIESNNFYKIVSDDQRILNLIKNKLDPDVQISKIFDSLVETIGGSVLLRGAVPYWIDCEGKPLAYALFERMDRKRVSEIVFSPTKTTDFSLIIEILNIAQNMGYIVPFEGATHLHYDAHKIANSKIFKKIINYLYSQENKLTKHVQTNVNCRKLGSWDESLIELVNKPFFSNLSWKDACNEILKCKITKYCNFNILNFISNNPQKYTFEVRIFPGSICSYRIQQWSFLFAEILNFCCEHENTSTNLFTSMISEHCNNLLYEN